MRRRVDPRVAVLEQVLNELADVADNTIAECGRKIRELATIARASDELLEGRIDALERRIDALDVMQRAAEATAQTVDQALAGGLDALEARVAALEARQFPTGHNGGGS